MNLAFKGAYALIFTAALVTLQTHQASALPMPSMAVASPALVTPVACKYGSGKCPDVKPVHVAPTVNKQGPQDPTVDPDCKAYGNCHDGPNGAPAGAAAKKGPTTPKPAPVVASGIKGESKDTKHPDTIEVRKAGEHPQEYLAKPPGQLKTH
jgi:hypothetical protein